MDRSAEESRHEVSNDSQGLSDLISNASHGDSQALSELLSNPAFATKLMRIAANVLERYGSRGVYENAEDLKQEVYLKVLSNIQGIGDLRTDTEFFGWIHSLATNLYLNSLRRSVLEKRSVEERELLQRSVGERERLQSDRLVFTANSDTPLKEVLDKLDPEQGKILELVSQGYTARQIADKLGISHSTASRLVRQVLKTILGEVDELTRRMKKSQIEIEQEQELTRHLINELRA